MKAVIQRVTRASVHVNGSLADSIPGGMVILLGITHDDSREDIQWLCRKITGLRIFNDASGVMNQSILETRGSILLISQFTLHASVRKGNRPSYIASAPPAVAVPLYEQFITELESLIGKKISTGVFGASMQVELINDGPVTILLDSKNKT